MRLCLSAAALLLLPFAAIAETDQPLRRIVVTGTAETETAPDVATISAGVQTEAETAGDALAANAEAMTAVLAMLAREGIAPADLQTSQLTLDAIWEDRPGEAPGAPRVAGYAASNIVTIRLRDLPRLGAVIDALGGAGVNRIFGIGFEVADPRPHLDRAREAAVADARAKAEVFTGAAGVALGEVLSITESSGISGPGPFQARAQLAMDAPVAEGSVALAAQVEMVFAIE